MMTSLTDEMKADGWVGHDGGPCPVGRHDDVMAMFAHPYGGEREWTGVAHIFNRSAVIAYKPEQDHANG